FSDAGRNYNDGSSFNGFLINIRGAAISHVPQAELLTLQPILDSWVEPLPKIRPPKKQRTFVKDWKMPDLVGDLGKVANGRNFAQGQDAVYGALCLMCHRIGDQGGSVGPDLTAVASRYSREVILESILEPSKVISDQYANTDITLKDGTIL